MACKLDKDCVFADQQPDCNRVQICCNEKLAEKDAEIGRLHNECVDLHRVITKLAQEFLLITDDLRADIERLKG